MDGLKLFVVGSSSGNPDDLVLREGWALVIAESKKQAAELCDLHGGVAEIQFSRPLLLCDVPAGGV